MARRIAREGLVDDPAGNVSLRWGEGALITPTRVRYAKLRPSDLVEIDFALRVLSGSRPPSREAAVHAAIYTAREDVGGIVHTHSCHATAWSFLGEPLTPRLEDNDYFAIGDVRTAPPEEAQSPAAAARAVVEALGSSGAVLLSGHGVISVGDTVEEARTVAAVVERQARVAWLLRGTRSHVGVPVAGLSGSGGTCAAPSRSERYGPVVES